LSFDEILAQELEICLLDYERIKKVFLTFFEAEKSVLFFYSPEALGKIALSKRGKIMKFLWIFLGRRFKKEERIAGNDSSLKRERLSVKEQEKVKNILFD